MRRIIQIATALALSMNACQKPTQHIDLQGHRGCRGEMPENTIQAFTRALDYGVTTLEMDVVISKDHAVVVSHEPFFSHEISALSGIRILENEEKQYNMFQMTYEEIKQYDVGMQNHSRFPNQQKVPAHKPLLSDVISICEKYAVENSLKAPLYNIEIKRKPELDSVYHPSVSTFVQLVLSEINKHQVPERMIIQSFDIESLKLVKERAPYYQLSLLVESGEQFGHLIKQLGFNPDIYSPSFDMVTKSLIANCKKLGIKVIPWTVNDLTDVDKLVELGVDGIITDYPGRVKQRLLQEGIIIQ